MRRFRENNKRLLIEALRQQPTLSCSEPLIKKLAAVATAKDHDVGTSLILQDADDNQIAFILSGCVDIFVKGEKVAQRKGGQHVGEMSVIDPTARRSATVTATAKTTVAWVKEKDFSKIAKDYPDLWRNLARELADRLRQRGALVRDKNPQPIIFVGSSAESLDVARAIHKALAVDRVKVELWKQGVFGISEVNIESLEKIARKSDFAVLVLSADDKMKIRRREKVAPRDNVVFELGIFMGAIGRERTFMVVERKSALRLPPDIDGVTYLPFRKKRRKPVPKDIADAIAKIRKRISELQVR
jgi:CRP/FNR family cyclic AMP-dependent transcriptional regulator